MPLSRAARLASLTLCLWAAPPQAEAAFELPPIDRIVQYQPRLPLQVVTADGVEIAGPWLDRYLTDVALAPDGTAWISARPPWSDPLAQGGVIVVDRDTCEAQGDPNGLATAMPPFSLAVWGAW
jgi:hypothetical protein